MRRFRVERELGQGGFGRVLLARELGPAVVTPVAIKLAHGRQAASPDDARRARDEARLLACLDHPAIVRLQSLIQTQHGPALILEYVPGFTLHQILRSGDRLPVVPALELVAEVADALDAGWSQAGPNGQPLRLLHRDLKPGNLAITPRGAVKVLDFGIARAASIGREVQSGPVPVGTVDYMAPERTQRRGQEGAETPAGDVFSLGLVLFGALTGAFHGGLPYEPEGWALFRVDVEAELTAALAGTRLEGFVAALVLDMLEVDPARRPTPAELRERALALARELGGEGLRPWAQRAVAGMPTPRPEALSGYAWEGAEIVEVGAEAPPTVEAPPPARRGGRLRRARPGVAWAPVGPKASTPDALDAISRPPPPRRVWASRLGVAIGLLVLALGLRGPEPLPRDAGPQVVGVRAEPLPVVSPESAPALVEASPPSAEPPALGPVRLFARKVPVALTGEALGAGLLTPRGEIALPAEVRPGVYTLRVRFLGQEPIDFPDLEIGEGERWEIRCSAALLQCRAVAVEEGRGG